MALTVGGGALAGAMMTALVAWMAAEGQAPPFMRERDWHQWDNAYLIAAGARGQEDIDRVASISSRERNRSVESECRTWPSGNA